MTVTGRYYRPSSNEYALNLATGKNSYLAGLGKSRYYTPKSVMIVSEPYKARAFNAHGEPRICYFVDVVTVDGYYHRVLWNPDDLLDEDFGELETST